MAEIFFGSSWEDSRILPSCIVILVVFVLSIVVCNTALQVNMPHTVQYNTEAKHATHGSKMQYFPAMHDAHACFFNQSVSLLPGLTMILHAYLLLRRSRIIFYI